MTGLIIAIERELKAFLKYGENIREEKQGFRTLFFTTIRGKEIVCVKSGCGLIDASAACEMLISVYKCDLIINFGVAGALKADMKVKDLFLVEKVFNRDYDTSPIDRVKKYQYDDMKDEFIPLDRGLIDLVLKRFPGLCLETVSSGDDFVEDMEEKKHLKDLGAGLCDMELASIARIAFLHKVRALSVKCISDSLEGDGGDFNKNVEESAKKAFELIVDIIEFI